MLVYVYQIVEQVIEFFESEISMKDHEAELFVSFFVESEYLFFSTIGISFDHNNIVVIKQPHDDALFYLWLLFDCQKRFPQSLVASQLRLFCC